MRTKLKKKNTRSRSFPWTHATHGIRPSVLDRTRFSSIFDITLFASIRTSARCHCCAFSQQLMAALAKNRDMEPHDIQHRTHDGKTIKPTSQDLQFWGGKPSKPGNFFQGNYIDLTISQFWARHSIRLNQHAPREFQRLDEIGDMITWGRPLIYQETWGFS